MRAFAALVLVCPVLAAATMVPNACGESVTPVVRLLAPVVDDDPPRELPPARSDSSGKKNATESSPPRANASLTAAGLIADDVDLGLKRVTADEPCPECLYLCEVPSRWSLRADFGDGVGYTRGFTYLEGFVPFYQPDPGSIIFGDGRVVNFYDDDRWEFNLGAGYRRHFEDRDMVLGANLFYDGRHTDYHFFHQIGVGGEALFDRWECRVNGYIIVGPAHKLIAESDVGSLVGNLLILDRFQTREVAMGGLDAEIGALLPILPQFSPRVFAGYYHYSAQGMPSVNGIRGRFEAWLTQNVSLHAAIQNDTVFDTTVSGGFAIHFGGARVRRDGGPRSAEERLGQRVVRDVNIVIAQQQRHERDIFVADIDRSPNSGSGGGSSGSSPPSPGTSPDPGKTPSPTPDPGTTPCPQPKPPCTCLPFPGRPGDPATFPGKHFPPGFHHDCFPGHGRYKHLFDDDDYCEPLPRIHGRRHGHNDDNNYCELLNHGHRNGRRDDDD